MANSGKVLGTLLVLWAVLAGVSALPGGFRFLTFETDMAHLADILLRLEQGAQLHSDISTPLGAWGFAPFEVLMRAGVPMGHALIWGQALVGALLIPLLWWAGTSRLRTGGAIALGASALIIMAGLTYGRTDASVTFAMHYNRWSWALLLPVLVLVLLPPRSEDARHGWPPLIDGLVIGAAMFALAMIKASSFMAFAPIVILGLVLARNWRGLAVALGVGALGLVWLVATRGVAFILAYADELLVVSRSQLRTAPGASLPELLASPAHLPVTVLAIAALLTMRRVSPGSLPLLFVLLLGAYWATFQNYGNDPLWLIPLGLLLWDTGARPIAGPIAGKWANVLRFEALAAAVIVAPVLFNFALSPLRHLQTPPGGFVPLVLAAPQHGDLQMPASRVSERLLTRKYLEGKAAIEPSQFAGRTLARCGVTGGLITQVRAHVAEIDAAALGLTTQPYVADLFSPHWMMVGWDPLDGSAPWYYGGLPGFKNATHLLVPDCPFMPKAREKALDLIESWIEGKQGRGVTEVLRGTDFTLYRVER
ncbi:hypothetical protein [Rhodalgimonas zhirmunskyi]|uniref:Uncharacterized protein n=1 Tax=Rhodalgimonas zhirmunskyi TaxID=2964767 RepID=A0AAJ1U9L2_9RHOB|nr:hypothetical protein [Rhodoalgimonas zhirmunskyi]MDQ2093783.1 hypothetical protein [Rhodoalgimonas zhirmunskyi]